MPSVKAVKVMRTNENGTPDIFVSVAGRVVILEVKRPGSEPTQLQQKRLLEWGASGAVVAVVRSEEDVEKILDSI